MATVRSYGNLVLSSEQLNIEAWNWPRGFGVVIALWMVSHQLNMRPYLPNLGK